MNTPRIAVVFSVLAVIIAGAAAIIPEREIQTQTIVREEGRPAVGALAGPDIASPYLRWGGVAEWAGSRTMNGDAASTTICNIQAPTASSTLTFAGVRLNTGTGTAMTVRMYKSAQAGVTGTNIVQGAAAGNTEVALVGTSTGIGANGLFSNGQWLVVQANVSAGGNGTSSPTGTCAARWITL